MASPSEKSRGVGIWANPELFEQCAGLPVVKTIRSITSNVIRQRMHDSPQTVFSIGIGPAVMYEIFRPDIVKGNLKLIGIDILPDMLNKTITTLGQWRLVSSPAENRSLDAITLACKDVREDFDLSPASVDIVEAGLVLHHILEREVLVDIMKRVDRILRHQGVFILGDIDVAIGEYIDAKKKQLENSHSKVSIDFNTGEFVCSNGAESRIRILDTDNPQDKTVLLQMEKITCEPLEQEMEAFNQNLRDAILANTENARKGLEWHRAIDGPDGWLAIIHKGFKNYDIQVIRPANIKSQFPSVLDNPFIVIVTKR